jgi:hypothetical protein
VEGEREMMKLKRNIIRVLVVWIMKMKTYKAIFMEHLVKYRYLNIITKML